MVTADKSSPADKTAILRGFISVKRNRSGGNLQVCVGLTKTARFVAAMKRPFWGVKILLLAFIGFLHWNAIAQDANTNLLAWLTRPLPLMDCLNLALQQNATILKAKNDLEAS